MDPATRAKLIALPPNKVSFTLDEAEAITGLKKKCLRRESALGNLIISKVSPRTSIILRSDLEAFLAAARERGV
jgi:hypothetical protein